MSEVPPSSSSGFSLGSFNLGSFVSGVGGVVNSIGQAAADKATAAGETLNGIGATDAATAAYQNALYSKLGGQIKALQTQRQVDLTIGAQKADVAAAGFKESGSALNLLQDSQQQGALAVGVVNTNSNIQTQGYLAQYHGYQAQAQAAGAAAGAASSAAGMQTAGAVIGTVATVVGTVAAII